MGLFDFLKNVGKDIFGGGDEAADISKHLQEELGASVSDLQVEFQDGNVKLSGNCESCDVKEKAVLIAGNLKGVEGVDNSGLQSPPAEVQTEFYTVVSGDSLSKIAKKYYGNASKYPTIFEANREVIKDPDLIYPGQQLRIPMEG